MRRKINVALFCIIFIASYRQSFAQQWSTFPCSSSNLNSSVLALGLTSGGDLITGGGFTSKVGLYNNSAGCTSINFNGVVSDIRAVAEYNGNIYAAGVGVSPIDSTSIYRFAGGVWTSVAYVKGLINCFTVFNNQLVAGGVFDTLNGTVMHGVARWNGTTWSALGSGFPGSGSGYQAVVRTLGVYNGELYAGGDHLTPNYSTQNFAKWNGTTWVAVGSGISGTFNTSVYTMTSHQGSLYIGGHFSNAGGLSVNNIAQWNGTLWSSLGNGLVGNDSVVFSLCSYSNELYAAGIFNNASGTPVSNFAKWNGVWNDLNGGITNGFARAMIVHSGRLIVAGLFGTAGGLTILNNMARLSSCTQSITATGSLSICSGSTVQLNASGGTSYQWLLNGMPINGATNSTYYAGVAGSYNCSITTSCGVLYSNTLSLTVKTTPTAVLSASGPTTFCAGESVYLFSSSGSGYSYTWFKYGNIISGAFQQTYIASTAGTYKVQVQSPNGCTKKSNPITVTVNPLPQSSITANGPVTFCNGDSVKLTANSGGGLSYQWKRYSNLIPGATTINYVALQAGNYKCIVTNNNGCSRVSNPIIVSVPCRIGDVMLDENQTISVYPNPSSEYFLISLSSEIAVNSRITVYNSQGQEIKNFVLEHFDKFLKIYLDKPGIYTLRISNAKTLYSTKLVKIDFQP